MSVGSTPTNIPSMLNFVKWLCLLLLYLIGSTNLNTPE